MSVGTTKICSTPKISAFMLLTQRGLFSHQCVAVECYRSKTSPSVSGSTLQSSGGRLSVDDELFDELLGDIGNISDVSADAADSVLTSDDQLLLELQELLSWHLTLPGEHWPTVPNPLDIGALSQLRWRPLVSRNISNVFMCNVIQKSAECEKIRFWQFPYHFAQFGIAVNNTWVSHVTSQFIW